MSAGDETSFQSCTHIHWLLQDAAFFSPGTGKLRCLTPFKDNLPKIKTCTWKLTRLVIWGTRTRGLMDTMMELSTFIDKPIYSKLVNIIRFLNKICSQEVWAMRYFLQWAYWIGEGRTMISSHYSMVISICNWLEWTVSCLPGTACLRPWWGWFMEGRGQPWNINAPNKPQKCQSIYLCWTTPSAVNV